MAQKTCFCELWCQFAVCFKKQFPLFFAKIDKIAYTSNSKDAKHSNRDNFICVQDINTIFACIVGFLESSNSNTLSKISREPRELPWQPNLGQKIALISFLQGIEKFIACTVGISGLVNFNTLSEFLRERRELPWQPNLNKNKPILH